MLILMKKILDNLLGVCKGGSVMANSMTRFQSRHTHKVRKRLNFVHGAFFVYESPGGLCAGPSGRWFPCEPVFEPCMARLFCFKAEKADFFHPLTQGGSL